MINPLDPLGREARAAAAALAQASTALKNRALDAIATELNGAKDTILAANRLDVDKASGLSAPMRDRLRLDDERFAAMREAVQTIRDLPDPVDRLLETAHRPNGLRIEKRSVPIGVIGIIFESRPNVALDAAALCLKSGNACILRGGSEGWNSVEALVTAIQSGLQKAGMPRNAVQVLPSADRALVGALLALDRYVDVIVPRGGKSLIARVRSESRIPVFSHLDGVCHVYIDDAADPDKAVAIAVNAKLRRTSVCGAAECLILHRAIVAGTGKRVIDALVENGCEMRVPPELLALNPALKPACADDYGHEFLAPIMAVAIVETVEDAVAFVNEHGSQHTDAIVTEDRAAADYFLRHVTSAIALHNASTQFADGGEFGKGAEIGIATGKLHARGPVGLEELTTYQYRVHGTGQVRG